MAKIYGIELKGVTRFKGHEGEPLTQGNIYMDGKKVGYYSDDFHGGPINLQIDEPYKEKFYKIVHAHIGEDKFMADEIFIEDLVNLGEFEKDFKRAMKKGYKAMMVVDHPSRYPISINTTDKSVENTIKWLDENGYEEYKVDGKYNITPYINIVQFTLHMRG